MKRACETCGGSGLIAWGRQIGPEEWSGTKTCEVCGGSGEESAMCAECGDLEATREAWVVDSQDPRKASLKLLCVGCHDHIDTKLAMSVTRGLRATEAEDRAEQTESQDRLRRIQALSAQLVEIQRLLKTDGSVGHV